MRSYHPFRVTINSVDFAEVAQLQASGQWDAAGQLLADAARQLERAGAEALVLCTNTMHKVASAIEDAVTIPLIHIADPTAQAIQQARFQTVGLLGTRFTMEQDFYRGRLVEKHALDVLVPEPADREIVHRVIYAELVLGRILPDSKQRYLDIIDNLVKEGAEGVILGCTEIGLLVKAEDCKVPLFDTTRIHAVAAVEYALAE